MKEKKKRKKKKHGKRSTAVGPNKHALQYFITYPIRIAISVSHTKERHIYFLLSFLSNGKMLLFPRSSLRKNRINTTTKNAFFSAYLYAKRTKYMLVPDARGAIFSTFLPFHPIPKYFSPRVKRCRKLLCFIKRSIRNS